MPNPGEMAGETGEAHQSQMRTLLGQDPPRPWPTPMAPTDGSNGTEASDCVGVPPVRLCDRPSRRATAVDRVLGSAGVGGGRAIMSLVASGYCPAPETPVKQPSSRAHRHTRRASRERGKRARSSEPSARARRGARGCSVCARARARTHTETQATICEHRDHSYLLLGCLTGVSGAGQ